MTKCLSDDLAHFLEKQVRHASTRHDNLEDEIHAPVHTVLEGVEGGMGSAHAGHLLVHAYVCVHRITIFCRVTFAVQSTFAPNTVLPIHFQR